MTGTSWEECAGSTTPALKLGGSPAPSSGPFRLAHVPSARDEISCRQAQTRCTGLQRLFCPACLLETRKLLEQANKHDQIFTYNQISSKIMKLLYGKYISILDEFERRIDVIRVRMVDILIFKVGC